MTHLAEVEDACREYVNSILRAISFLQTFSNEELTYYYSSLKQIYGDIWAIVESIEDEE